MDSDTDPPIAIPTASFIIKAASTKQKRSFSFFYKTESLG